MINLKKETIHIEEWLNIQDCPIQRDTARHAETAKRKHLKEMSPTHANVSAATLDSGEVYKLDGHTRSYLWEKGYLDPPSQILYVDMYYCETMSEVEDLYQQFDNSDATETLRDKIYGAYRLYGFTPSSALIMNGGVASALSIILGISFNKISVYNAMGQFIDTIQLLDKHDLPPKPFISPILSAVIATAHNDGESAMSFWRAYGNDEGVKNGRERDAVQALTELVLSLRTTNGGAFGAAKRTEIAGKAVSAYLSHKRGRGYTHGIKTTDFVRYVTEHASITRGAKAG